MPRDLMSNYILNEKHEPVRCDNVLTWARWIEQPGNRIVARTDLGDGVRVSTVFLGIDHRWDDTPDPILFETMIFGLGGAEYQERFTSWDDAIKGHEAAILVAGERMAARS